MFKSVEDVQNTPVEELVELVKKLRWNAGYKDILSEEIYTQYSEASSLVNKTELLAERIAFAIRDKIESENNSEDCEEDDDEDFSDLSEFMNAIAAESGEMYSGEWDDHPDRFWVPSTCW